MLPETGVALLDIMRRVAESLELIAERLDDFTKLAKDIEYRLYRLSQK